MLKRFITYAIVFILLLLTTYRIFNGIRDSPIEQWDEQTNISVVEESEQNKTFPVLILDNKPFFEKPPLWYWITILLSKVIGFSPLSMRLVSVMSAILIIFFTVFFSWRSWGMVSGIITWIILLSTHQLFIKNAGGFFSTHTFKSADLDALQIFFLLLAYGFCLTMLEKNRGKTGAGIATGCAVLVKGPLGILPLFSLFIYFFIKRNKIPRIYWDALGISVIIILPWYIYMTFFFGSKFLVEHFLYHITLRTVIPIEGHTNPVWYYVILLLNPAVFPASPLFICSLVWVLVQKKLPYVLLLSILCLLVPTLMNTRLSWYILPFYPFAALLVGFALNMITKKGLLIPKNE